MDGRVTLRSHLDRSTIADATRRCGRQTVIGPSPVAAIRTRRADRRWAALAGITGAERRHQCRRRSAKGYRCRRRRTDAARVDAQRPVAAVLSEGSCAAGNLARDGAALRRDRSARRIGQSRKQHLGRHHLLDPPAGQRHYLDLLRAGHGAMSRQVSPSTARKPRSCSRSTRESISSSSTGARRNSC